MYNIHIYFLNEELFIILLEAYKKMDEIVQKMLVIRGI